MSYIIVDFPDIFGILFFFAMLAFVLRFCRTLILQPPYILPETVSGITYHFHNNDYYYYYKHCPVSSAEGRWWRLLSRHWSTRGVRMKLFGPALHRVVLSPPDNIRHQCMTLHVPPPLPYVLIVVVLPLLVAFSRCSLDWPNAEGLRGKTFSALLCINVKKLLFITTCKAHRSWHT